MAGPNGEELSLQGAELIMASWASVDGISRHLGVKEDSIYL